MTPDFTGNLSFFNASICRFTSIDLLITIPREDLYKVENLSSQPEKKSIWQEKVLLLHLRRREAGIIIIIIIINIVPPRMEYIGIQSM